MPTARLCLIGMVALAAYSIEPDWFGWLSRFERQVVPPPDRTFGTPPFTGVVTDIGVPIVQMLGFMFGVATAGALMANLLLRISRIDRRRKPKPQA